MLPVAIPLGPIKPNASLVRFPSPVKTERRWRELDGRKAMDGIGNEEAKGNENERAGVRGGSSWRKEGGKRLRRFVIINSNKGERARVTCRA